MSDLEKLFNPRAIGIVGVNDKQYGGGYFLDTLQKGGYKRPIYIFNPRLKGSMLLGVEVLGSIIEVPDTEPIDYVILAVPAEQCPTLLEEIGQKKVPFVTVFTSGFSEIGNVDLEVQLLDIARKYNIRLIGPNCMGIFVLKSKVSISPFNFPGCGDIGMIFQSGGQSVFSALRAQSIFGAPFSKVISIGNQIDLNFVDFLKYFLKDDETNIIGLYVENLKSKEIGREFFQIVKKLSLSNKPVIIWKVGYGGSAQEAILSHTGGLAGSMKIWKAIAKQTGAFLVKSSSELVNLAMSFSHLKNFSINRNMGVTGMGGGVSIEVTDLFERYGLKIPKIEPKTVEKFKTFLPEVNTIFRNPLDLGGAGAIPSVFYKTLITLDSDPNVSAVVFIKTYDFNEEFLQAVIRAREEMKKPLICVSEKIYDDMEDHVNKLKFKQEMFKRQVPIFESAEEAARSLRAICEYNEFLIKTSSL
ncbi:MAG: CoA-binding protein [Candidatus Lokiarchaeota archaeon]|nr:CoA-binding protein [Candidatus Lokiarchaeota archaeon]